MLKKSKKYTVIVDGNAYEATEGVLKGILDIASSSVQNGVYAAKKKDVIVLMNKPNLSRECFRALTKEYNRKGFVLLHNRGAAHG